MAFKRPVQTKDWHPTFFDFGCILAPSATCRFCVHPALWSFRFDVDLHNGPSRNAQLRSMLCRRPLPHNHPTLLLRQRRFEGTHGDPYTRAGATLLDMLLLLLIEDAFCINPANLGLCVYPSADEFTCSNRQLLGCVCRPVDRHSFQIFVIHWRSLTSCFSGMERIHSRGRFCQ